MTQKEFIYDVSANVEMEFTDFDMLFETAAGHYDHTVRESTTQGHFMFGNRNRRNWAAQDDDFAISFEAEWTSKQLNLMMKALEMTRTPEAFALQFSMRKIFFAIQDRWKQLDNTN